MTALINDPTVGITTGTVSVSSGGTGITSTTAYGVLTGGTTATDPFQNAGAGTAGQFLQSNGAGALPTWAAPGSLYYFKASFSAIQTDITGDGTNLSPIVWDTTLVNAGSAYNAGTGYFTCPVSGFYFFSMNLFFDGITSDHTSMNCSIQNNSLNEYAFTNYLNPYPIYDIAAGGRHGFSGSGAIYCNAGNTVRSVWQVSGGAKVIRLYAGTGYQSNFSGFYIGA